MLKGSRSSFPPCMDARETHYTCMAPPQAVCCGNSKQAHVSQ
jgi:hypothetical protein